tara:strand:- start:1254 stop:1763 length:510 start_codon:yes stop_codon:yes gene_type:complete
MKLNIGGESKKEGWKILNIQKKPDIDFIGNINNLDQFDDESCDEIYASHIIEHVDQKTVLNTLKGINRILKKNGKFYISVPDMDSLCHFFISPLANKKIKFHVMRMIFGGQVDEYDYHYFGWNYEFLSDYLTQANFSEFKRVQSFGLFDDTSDFKPYGFPISLNVIATK